MDKSREELKKSAQSSEFPKIRKDTAVITNERYKTPKTSPLVFHFEPHPFVSSDLRVQDCTIKHHTISGKDLYIIDNFFLASEAEELRKFSSQGQFSREIFADHESKEKGETADRAMDNKEKWTFFANPPQAVKEIYKFLSWLADRLNADITTLPWEMYDKDICSPAVATNRVVSKSQESMELGKHQDYNTEKGISFGIPQLYSKEPALHSNSFINGSTGKPWLISLMLYSTSPGFSADCGLGTLFWENNGNLAVCADSQDMRFVIFEGDIIHTIEKSKFPPDENRWRVSYVFKLVVNPRKENQSMKKDFLNLVKSFQKIKV